MSARVTTVMLHIIIHAGELFEECERGYVTNNSESIVDCEEETYYPINIIERKISV